MKTLILYATKYGATAEAAQRMADKLGGATVCDLKSDNIPSLVNFDCVILGSSVYAGKLRKEARAYVAANSAALCQKTLGLFVCGLHVDISFFYKNYPPGLPDRAKTKGFLGGIFDPEKGNAAERLIMRAITKQSGYVTTLDDEAIDQFVDAIKK